MKVFGKRAGAFTLIELLVVVSIIALLVSILLPALGKAREQAKTIKCAAHLKSMGLAMQMYANEYRDYYPALLMTGDLSVTNPGFSHWWQLVMPFVDGNDKLLQCPSVQNKSFVRVDWDSDTFLTGYGLNYCGWNWKPDNEWVDGEPGAGFGYVVTPDRSKIGRRGGCVKGTRVHSPSSFIMVGDADRNVNDSPERIRSIFTYGILGPPRVNGQEYPQEDLPTVHNGGANIVFIDGHVSWYRKTDLLADKNLHMWMRGR